MVTRESAASSAPDCAGRNGAHTPGPWVIDPCWDILGNTDDGNGMVCQVTTDGVPIAEASSNARLIAAAPELLEALSALDRMNRGLDWCDPDEQARRWSCARAAIAKAEGRRHARLL